MFVVVVSGIFAAARSTCRVVGLLLGVERDYPPLGLGTHALCAVIKAFLGSEISGDVIGTRILYVVEDLNRRL